MCGTTYISPTQSGANSVLTEVDTSSNPWVYIPIGTANAQYNAMAYDATTDTLYAMQRQTTTLLSIDAMDGSVDPLGAVTGLPAGNYHVGAFAPDGFMYVRHTGDNDNLYRIDVDATPPSATQVPLSASLAVSDLAWFDGLFYGNDHPEGVLKSVTTDGMVTTIGDTGGVTGTGAMFSASNGVFAVANDGSGAFQFDVTTGLGTRVSDAPSAPGIDGARCLDAPLQLEAELSVTKTDNSETYVPGEDVVYEIVVTNNGPAGVQNASVDDPLPTGITTASWTCGGAGGGVCGVDSGSGPIVDTPDMEDGGSVTYTLTVSVPGDYTGELANTVTVDVPDGFIDPAPDNNTATDVDQSEFEPGIALEKTGSGPEPLELGSTIEYEFLVTNVGNVPLTDVTLTDPLPGMSPVNCPDDTLEPKAEMTCTANYTVTQEDVDAGVIENTATVTGQPPGAQPQVEDEASAIFPPEQGPGISLEKSGSGPDPLTVGSTINYEFLVTNTGNVTLNNVTVDDPLSGLSPIECPETTLAPGAEMTCTATYEVTQADVEAGVIENTATATGETPTGGPEPTDSSTTTFPPEEPVPALPPLAFVLLVALLATATLWTLRRARV